MSNKPFIIEDLSDDKGTVADARRVGPSSGGGTVDAASVAAAIGDMTAVQAAGALEDLGGVPVPTNTKDLVSTHITIALAADNTIYEYGELEELEITAIPSKGDFIIRFTSGSTPTVTYFPVGMKFPTADNLFPECKANTDYEINCSNGKATWDEWPVISS